MSPTREVVYHLALRYLRAKRMLRRFANQHHNPHAEHVLWARCDEAQHCYQVARKILSDMAF